MSRELRDVLESILAGVVVVGADGRVEQLNSAACRLLERSPELSAGLPVERLVPAEHAVARLARQALSAGVSAAESDLRVERRTEDARVDVSASPLFDAEGRIDGAVVVVRDRSVQRRLEELETERARFEDFGRIAAGLAHEIKNPLGGIRGAGELLAGRAPNEKAREIAELVVREATRIASLVDELMVFARGDELRLGPTNLHRVLDDVLDLVGLDPLAAGVSIVRTYDPSLPEIWADADRLRQVFLNLVRNALQAMTGGSRRLTITTRRSLDPRITLEPGRSVPQLVVGIADTGQGMGQEERRQAATPFFSTRAGGTGLGLAVADYWVGRHRGTLEIESAQGEGTEVRVSLPLRREP